MPGKKQVVFKAVGLSLKAPSHQKKLQVIKGKLQVYEDERAMRLSADLALPSQPDI